MMTRERAIDRALERLHLVLDRMVPDWLGVAMFRTLLTPALRDFARDVEDEVFGLVERLAKAYGDAAIDLRAMRSRVSELERYERACEELNARVGRLRRARDYFYVQGRRRIREERARVQAARESLRMANAINGMLEVQLEDSRQETDARTARVDELLVANAEALRDRDAAVRDAVHELALEINNLDAAWGISFRFQERTIVDLGQQVSQLLIQLRDAVEGKDQYQRAALTAVQAERDRCLADLCSGCRDQRPALRIQRHSYGQGDGHYQHPHVQTFWVHMDPAVAPFLECLGSAIRERARG